MSSIALEQLSPSINARESRQRAQIDFTYPSKVIALNPLVGRANDFLSFIALLQHYRIPSISPCLLSRNEINGGHSNVEATGSLGAGGQYYVDRYYENQRYPSTEGLRAQSNIVYKRLHRVDNASHATSGQALQDEMLSSFIREIKVLGRFRDHVDIVDLLGIAWEVSDGHLRPVLALEYAQHNSLSNFWRSTPTFLTFREKQKLCLDITNGIHALHEAGIVWGDCKPENVLIFQDPIEMTAWKAKLNDFGGSVSKEDDTTRFITYSHPWTAPEVLEAKSFDALKKAEIFSCGLLLWAVYVDGRHFSRYLWQAAAELDGLTTSNVTQTVNWKDLVSIDEIEQLKRHKKLKEKVTEVLHSYIKFRTARTCSPPFTTSDTPRLLHILRRTVEEDHSKRWVSMSTVIQHIQAKGPASPSTEHQRSAPIPDSKDASGASYNLENLEMLDIEYLFVCYGALTQLSSIATAIFERLAQMRSCEALYKCALCCAIGFGTDRDVMRSMEFLRESARLSYTPAKTLFAILRLGHHLQIRDGHDNLGETPAEDDLLLFDDFNAHPSNATLEAVANTAVSELDEEQWLQEAVLQGSPYAKGVLQLKDPEALNVAIEESRNRLERRCYPHSDSPLFLAAESGDEDYLRCLLEGSHVDLDACNVESETALLVAARTGHLSTFLQLLDHGGNVNVTDKKGATILHWLTFFGEAEIEQIQPFLVDITVENATTKAKISSSALYGGTLEPGTPLDWAVDQRNLAAIRALLKLGADCEIASQSRPSASCRAAGRHDHEVLSILVEEGVWGSNIISNLDPEGMSCMEYALQPCFLIDRIFINGTVDLGMDKVLELLLDHGADASTINDRGDSALYSAAKWQDAVSTERLCGLLATRYDLTTQILTVSGPNFWSPLRRSLYSSESVFGQFISRLPSDPMKSASTLSLDGLTLLHELAFLPTDHGLACARMLKDHGILSTILHYRILPHRQRGALTPFQLAVLCQKFELAQFLIASGANPLAGVDNARFLGYLISYQLLDPAEISTFLFAILDDPIVNAIRCFPPPSSMQPCVAYLLSHEIEWWSQCSPPSIYISLGYRSSRYYGQRSKYRFDSDTNHDPMIAKTPGITAVVEHALSALEPTDSRAIAHSGYTGLLDANEAGFGARCYHAMEFGSFLIKYRRDGPTEQRYGHKYVTAHELALDVVEKKPASKEVEQVLFEILDFFNGPQYCNYPYVIYLPFVGRTFFKHLRRRDTTLHRAVHLRKVGIVQKLLKANADIQMANINWQTPLHLAVLLQRDKDPNLPQTRGSFFTRLLPATPARITAVDYGSSIEDRIVALLEAKETSRPWRLALPLFRGLMEVRWPWDEYEADDMGIRFLMFYFIILSFFVGAIMLLTGLVGFMPKFLFLIGDVYKSILEPIIMLGECFKECHANGSDPRVLCTSLLFPPNSNLAYATQGSLYIPAYTDWVASIIDALDDCFDDTLPSQPASNGTDDFEHWMPGCDTEYIFEDHPWVKGNGSKLEELAEKFVRDHSKCECSWGGKPRFNYRPE